MAEGAKQVRKGVLALAEARCSSGSTSVRSCPVGTGAGPDLEHGEMSDSTPGCTRGPMSTAGALSLEIAEAMLLLQHVTDTWPI